MSIILAADFRLGSITIKKHSRKQQDGGFRGGTSEANSRREWQGLVPGATTMSRLANGTGRTTSVRAAQGSESMLPPGE